MKVLSIFSLCVNVTLHAFQRSPLLSEQKGDPGGSEYPPLGGKVVVCGLGGAILSILTCSWLGLLQAVLLPDTILEARFER